MIHCWYVKARGQSDHEQRAAALGCEIILEDTSSQVDLNDSLPHVIVQVSRPFIPAQSKPVNHIFLEPLTVPNELRVAALKLNFRPELDIRP